MRDTVITHPDQPNFDGGQVLSRQIKIEPNFAPQNGEGQVSINSETNFDSHIVMGSTLQGTVTHQNIGIQGPTDHRTEGEGVSESERIDEEGVSGEETERANHEPHLKITFPNSPEQVKDLFPKVKGKKSASNQPRPVEKQNQRQSQSIRTEITQDLGDYRGRITRGISKALEKQGLTDRQTEDMNSKEGQGTNMGDKVVDQIGDQIAGDQMVVDQSELLEKRGSLQQIMQNVERMLTKLTMTKD